jgi:4-amino-4-deoxy-L-arabinose transferase-like glycosyltransferase
VPERPSDDLHWLRALRSAEPCRGRLKRGLALAMLALALVGAALGFAGSDGRLHYPDAFDYAQMGRQLAEGEGLTSLQAFPYVLGWLDAAGLDARPPWPVMWRFPLPIALRAASFRLLGPSDAAALLPPLLLSALTAPLLFLLANRLGGPLAGLLAAGLWIASPSQQQLALTGLTEPGATLLAVAIAGLALRARDEAGWPACAALGAALGLASLQRTNLLALAPAAIAAVALASTGRRAPRLAALAIAGGLVAAPWLARNALAFGEPLLNLTSDRGLLRLGLGSDPFYQLAIAEPDTVLRESLRRYPSGWSFAWLRASAPDMLGRELAWLLPVGVIAALADARRRGPRRATWALAWSGLVLTALVFAPPYPDVLRFYWPYAPLLLAATCAALLAAARRLPSPHAPSGLAVVVAAAFVLFAPRDDPAPLLPVGNTPPALEWLAESTPADALVASDASYAVAWQAQRASLRFAGNFHVMAQIDERIARIDALYLSARNAGAAGPLREPPLSNVFEPVASERPGALFLRRR